MGGDAKTGVLASGLALLLAGLGIASVSYLEEASDPQASVEASERIGTHEAVRLAGFSVFVVGFLVLSASLRGRTPRPPGRR